MLPLSVCLETPPLFLLEQMLCLNLTKGLFSLAVQLVMEEPVRRAQWRGSCGSTASTPLLKVEGSLVFGMQMGSYAIYCLAFILQGDGLCKPHTDLERVKGLL